VGSIAQRVLQPISNIGNMPPVVVGIGLSFLLRGEPGVALSWIGEGSTKSGGTHEALNLAAVHHLPVVFIIQNNQVALGTPVEVSHLPGRFDELHEAYGAIGWSFDGNNVLDAYAAARLAVERCLLGEGPVILSAETFRMGGHATHDEQEARVVLPADLFEHWGRRDPIGLYEEYLTGIGVSRSELEEIELAVSGEVDQAAEEALASRDTQEPAPTSALDDVYAD
jgi:TPP-dependent pyruvate/acetoin dehydrogenase alpha subunit